MRVLDLFCGAGGAAMGYHLAGFEVVGVDINPQPNYPFRFVELDALLVVDWALKTFDLIHASPPCQAYSTLRHSKNAGKYPDLVAKTREMLQHSGVPYVIENVPGAPLLEPIKLCGSMFNLRHDGYELRRHRLFEASFPIEQPACSHRDPVLGVYGDLAKNRRRSGRNMRAGIEDAQKLMGVDWMNAKEIVQAIPPAYTKFMGEAFLTQ